MIFGVFYVLGQVIKLQFLRVTGYTEGGANSSGMLRTTGGHGRPLRRVHDSRAAVNLTLTYVETLTCRGAPRERPLLSAPLVGEWVQFYSFIV